LTDFKPQPTTKFSHYQCDGYTLEFAAKKGLWEFKTPEGKVISEFSSEVAANVLDGIVNTYEKALEIGASRKEAA